MMRHVILLTLACSTSSVGHAAPRFAAGVELSYRNGHDEPFEFSLIADAGAALFPGGRPQRVPGFLGGFVPLAPAFTVGGGVRVGILRKTVGLEPTLGYSFTGDVGRWYGSRAQLELRFGLAYALGEGAEFTFGGAARAGFRGPTVHLRYVRVVALANKSNTWEVAGGLTLDAYVTDACWFCDI